MFKIGEFSRLTQVTIRMLRYYDEMGLLKPAKTDPWTGYRLYSVEQISVLNKIIYLRDSGFSVAEISAAISHDDSFTLRMLDKKQEEIAQNILTEQEKLHKIALAKKELECSKSRMHYDIIIKSVPSYQVLSLRKVIPDYYAEGQLWKELSAFAADQHTQISEQTFSIYHDEEYKEQQVDVEICAPVRTLGQNSGNFTYRHTEPVSHMACTMCYGSFYNIAGVYKSFAAWLQESGKYQMGTTSRQIVHRGPWNEEHPDNYLTELQIPLEFLK